MRQKIFILSLLLLAVGSARTQDTVRYGDSIYYFNPFTPREGDTLCGIDCDFIGQQAGYLEYMADSAMLVYGIACTPMSRNLDILGWGAWNSHFCSDSGDIYAVLITKEGEFFNRIDSVKWENRNKTNRCFDYLSMVNHRRGTTCNLDIDTTSFTLFEFYFKRPYIVEDTFYVGFFSTSMYVYGISLCNGQIYDISGCSSCSAVRERWLLADYMFPNGLQSGITDGIFTTGDDWGGIFPIIVPPDTDSYECPRVENFRLADYVDGRPLFNWNRLGGQQPFQVAYGPADQDLDSFRVVAASVPPYLLPAWDLDSTVVYAARCRGRCHHTCPIHDTIVWSEWSDTVQFCTGSRHTEGIEPTEEGRTVFVLRPNPTRSRVTVEAECAIRIVEVADMAGRVLMSERYDTDTRSATLDVGRLAQGSYLVRVKTEREEGVQKLIIE